MSSLKFQVGLFLSTSALVECVPYFKGRSEGSTMEIFTFNIEFDAAFSKFKLLAGRLNQLGPPELKKNNSGCLEKLNNSLQTHGQLKLPT